MFGFPFLFAPLQPESAIGVEILGPGFEQTLPLVELVAAQILSELLVAESFFQTLAFLLKAPFFLFELLQLILQLLPVGVELGVFLLQLLLGGFDLQLAFEFELRGFKLRRLRRDAGSLDLGRRGGSRRLYLD